MSTGRAKKRRRIGNPAKAAEPELLKTVPAKVDGVVIGDAELYDDGSVQIIISEDAPAEAVAKYKAMADEFMASPVLKNKE